MERTECNELINASILGQKKIFVENFAFCHDTEIPRAIKLFHDKRCLDHTTDINWSPSLLSATLPGYSISFQLARCLSSFLPDCSKLCELYVNCVLIGWFFGIEHFKLFPLNYHTKCDPVATLSPPCCRVWALKLNIVKYNDFTMPMIS